MQMTPLDDAAQQGITWAFWQAFADQDLFLMLVDEPSGTDLRPRVFDTSDGAMVLAFDAEDRLAAFSPVPVPYATLPGRVVAALAAGQGLALGLNLGSGAPSEQLFEVDALTWLGETLQSIAARQIEDRAARLMAPGVDEARDRVVMQVLQAAQGLVGEAVLAGVEWQGGAQGALLALPGLAAQHRPRVAQALAQAMALSGGGALDLDLAFPAPDEPWTDQLRRIGRRWRIKQVEAPDAQPPMAPGSDPSRPPRLK